MTLAFIEGLLSPTHLLIFVCPLLTIAAIVAVVVFVLSRKNAAAPTNQLNVHPTSPNADLERRRQELEVERMAIENEERRRKLGQP